jgi:hypothetical protein
MDSKQATVNSKQGTANSKQGAVNSEKQTAVAIHVSLPPPADCSLPTTHCSLPTAYCLLVLLLITTFQLPTPASGQRVVTAAQLNGTWRSRNGEFKIWALGKQKLRVEFSGSYEYDSPAGRMANTGEGSGVATIAGDTALFKPDGAEDECQITMRFIGGLKSTGGKLVVTQEGICGFGHNVTAAGTYRRVNTRKPRQSNE